MLVLGLSGASQAFTPQLYVQLNSSQQAGAFHTTGGIVSGAFTATGTVILGGAGNSVTASSNTSLSGAIFYANNGGEALSAPVTIGVSSTNSCGYLKGLVVQIQNYNTTVASATTVGANYAKAGLSGSFTPLCATDKLRITASGEEIDSNFAALDCQLTVYRNPGASQVDLAPVSGKGLCYFGDGGVAGFGTSCFMQAYDSPGSISATTYNVMHKFGAGSGTCTFTMHGVSTLNVEEIAQ